MRSLRLAACLALLLAAAAGCEDVRGYGCNATWSGALRGDPDLGKGFMPDQQAALTLAAVDALSMSGTLTLAPLFDHAPVASIARASGDAVGAVKVGKDALRSYLAFANAQSGPPALVVVSLFPDERVELRVIRGTDDLYGVFRLHRDAAMPANPACP